MSFLVLVDSFAFQPVPRFFRDGGVFHQFFILSPITSPHVVLVGLGVLGLGGVVRWVLVLVGEPSSSRRELDFASVIGEFR